MLVNYTEKDWEEIDEIIASFDPKIQEAEECVRQLRPNDSEPQYPAGAVFGSSEENSGSQQWKDARNALFHLKFEKLIALEELKSSIEQREFARLNNDRGRIIESAKDQVNFFIRSYYDCLTETIKTHKLGEKELPGIQAGILRVDGKNIYFDTDGMIPLCMPLLSLHFEALKDDPEATKELVDAVISVIADSPYTSRDRGIPGKWIDFGKKKTRSSKKLPVYDSQTEQTFFLYPTTPVNNIVMTLFSSGDVGKAADKINTINGKKVAKASFYQKEQTPGQAIRVETPQSSTIVSVLHSDPGRLYNITAKKILIFIENEIYMRSFFGGHLNGDVIDFPLQALVDKGLYTTKYNAGRAFLTAADTLTSIRVTANLKAGRKVLEMDTRGAETGGAFDLFPSMYIDANDCCHVRLNSDIDWAPVLYYYIPMPDSIWSLPDNAFELELEIFRRVRINANRMTEDGVIAFTVRLDAVAALLTLPLQTKNPKRDVKTPIETAVRQIVRSLDPASFALELATDPKAPLKSYLSGHLSVKVCGLYTKKLIEINNLYKNQTGRVSRRRKPQEEAVNTGT